MDEIIFKNGQAPAVNDVNLNKMQKNIKPNKKRVKLTSAVNKGGTVTLPSYYRVGTNCLDVYFMGERLLLSSDDTGTDGHYREVGTANSISNQIKLTTDWGCEIGEYFDFVIRGEYNAT